MTLFSRAPIYALALLCSSRLAGAQSAAVCAADPYADPSADPCNPLRYIPSVPGNAIATALSGVSAVLLTWRIVFHGGRFMAVLVIGAWTEMLGLALRFLVRQNLHSIGIYIGMDMLVVLSPCLFLAGDYILLGRLVNHLGAAKHLRPFKPGKLSTIFVLSDVTTFLLQGAGGGLSTSSNTSTAQLGSHIFLIGLCAQLGSFLLFTLLWAGLLFRGRNDRALLERHEWRRLYATMGLTCLCFIIRSIYRVAETSGGYVTYISSHEVYFLCFDTLPLWLGITSYVIFWPGVYINGRTRMTVGGESKEGFDGGILLDERSA